MEHHPLAPAPSSAPRVVARAVATALAATALAHLAGLAVSQVLDALHTAPDANIGAGLALLILPALLAPFLAHPLAWFVRLPRPVITVLASTFPYLLLAVGALLLWIRSASEAPASFLASLWVLPAANTVALTVTLSAAALLTNRHSWSRA